MVSYVIVDPRKDAVGFSHEQNDCSVRAIQIALNIPYSEAHHIIKTKTGRRDKGACYGFSSFVEKNIQYIKKLDPKPWKNEEKIGTLSKFIKNNPTGTWILRKNGHVFTVIDGVVYDSWNPGPKTQIKQAWQIK